MFDKVNKINFYKNYYYDDKALNIIKIYSRVIYQVNYFIRFVYIFSKSTTLEFFKNLLNYHKL